MPRTRRTTTTHHGLLGTVIDLTLDGNRGARARAQRSVVAEIERLEQVFSVFVPTSDINKWRTGEHQVPSLDLQTGLELSLAWQLRTGGLFNVDTGALTERWARAASRDEGPTRAEMSLLADSTSAPPFEVMDGRLRRSRSCEFIDLNGVAKGHIVDQAVTRAFADTNCSSIFLGAGGDGRHFGAGSVRIGIEDPQRPYDNAVPIDSVRIANEAIATSGSSRRSHIIAGERFSQIIDPRSGWPVEHAQAATAIAPTAAAADVLATALTIATPAVGLELVSGIERTACRIVDASGEVHMSPSWFLKRA